MPIRIGAIAMHVLVLGGGRPDLRTAQGARALVDAVHPCVRLTPPPPSFRAGCARPEVSFSYCAGPDAAMILHAAGGLDSAVLTPPLW